MKTRTIVICLSCLVGYIVLLWLAVVDGMSKGDVKTDQVTRPVQDPVTRPVQGPATKPNQPLVPVLQQVSADSDKNAFLALARQNVHDPAGLEIALWGEKIKGLRSVRFRCKLVGLSAVGDFQPGAKQYMGGDPVLLDVATIEYDGARIKQVHLQTTGQVWRPRE